MGWLSLVLPSLVPAFADGLRGLFAKLTGGAGAQPQNVGEAIRLMEAQTARVEALARLDALSPSASAWVADLRGAFRYVAVGGIVSAAVVAVFVPGVPVAASVLLLDMAGASMSFIIGERMYLGLRK
jgi:hypothetical protein